MLDAREIVLMQHQMSHQILDQLIADCDHDALHAIPAGSTNNSIAATYAHVIFVEDYLVNESIAGESRIYDRDGWQQKTGVAPQDGPMMSDAWARSVRMNLAPFREYATAVRDATQVVLSQSPDALLMKDVDLMGRKVPAIAMFARIPIYHIAEHSGEIAALKGVRGLKGLPF